MSEPVYEVKVKDGTESTSEPSMSEEQIAALVDTKSSEKAAAITERLKEELAESLSGKKSSRYGEKGPESWEKLHEDIKSEAVAAAEEKFEKRLEAERKSSEDKQKLTQKQVEDNQRKEYADMSAQWQSAVRHGVLPDISEEIKEKLKSGVAYDALSDDEQKDPGLRAYNEARLLHIQLKQEGKTDGFLETATYHYRQQPAGARAPVMGGMPSGGNSSSEGDFSYDEVVKNRKSRFNF